MGTVRDSAEHFHYSELEQQENLGFFSVICYDSPTGTAVLKLTASPRPISTVSHPPEQKEAANAPRLAGRHCN